MLEKFIGQYHPWLKEHLRKIQEHPCYDPSARHLYGRVHLPVAPVCNIGCNYCIREFDCVHETRPGVTSRVLTPEEALKKLEVVVETYPGIRVLGIAGPGEPLANEETFVTLELAQAKFPHLIKCLSSNGLLLADKLSQLKEYNISTITVTLNAVRAEIGEKIYAWINYKGQIYSGKEGARILLTHQMAGIKKAREAGIIVKVNTVYIPGINGDHLTEIAQSAKEWGATIQNIIPLIPQHRFSQLTPPTLKELHQAREACGAIIPQMRHCRQCRADAVGKLSKKDTFLSFSLSEGSKGRSKVFRVAVATSGETGRVDLHFGHAKNFSVYEVNDGRIYLLEQRTVNSLYCAGPECDDPHLIFPQIVDLLQDCQYLLCLRIGTGPAKFLKEKGIIAVMDFDLIEEAIRKL